MWESFWPDIVVAVVGAVIGSVLTVGIAVATYFITIRHRENQALNALVRELHERRAIAPIASPREIPGAAELDDYDRANRSVVSMRDEISRTRELVGQSPEVQLSLSEMKRACNRYLERAGAAPQRYWFLLDELRCELSEGVRRLSSVRKKLPRLEPGGGAF